MTDALVTGLGVVSPTGLGTDAFWSATVEGRSAIGPVTRFDADRYPARLAGEIAGFVAEDHLPGRLIPQTDRMTRLALVAADWALDDAGIDPAADHAAFDMGVVTASSSGGFEFGQNELRKLWSQGGQYVSAYQSFAWFYAVNSGQISIRNGMKGPSGVIVSDQAGGLDALAHTRRLIRKGTPLIVSGGVDAALCPWGWVAQLASDRLTTSDAPDSAYLPFDKDASGHVPGEGGAILLVEDAVSARGRGVTGYGVIAGYGASFDPRPDSGREPGLRYAIEVALTDARVTADQVDVVFADAAGLPELDRVEADALAAVFGPGAVPVTAPKTTTGRLGSGGAPLDLAGALLALRHGVIPPTVHVRPDPGYRIDLVTGAAREVALRTALVVARGYGGFNSAVVVRRAEPS
ncbi:putative chain length determinant [Actinacidiphila reveromycinica]|uniref:Putative chain length determinant n=1 Tax=Actinacidiphila reveromycinica TaxID=659352 RepID=A0A7U3UZI3_9ACTN|nr:ketosynthase chain-length factor [Streptomyces sp. SN-593]BBB01462.1 putative chain length determinant [Streptomyces sp. SN-593]